MYQDAIAQTYPARPITMMVPQNVGGTNDIVGRLGGDEFGVMLAHFESASELEVVLERMLAARVDAAPSTQAATVGLLVYAVDAYGGVAVAARQAAKILWSSGATVAPRPIIVSITLGH